MDSYRISDKHDVHRNYNADHEEAKRKTRDSAGLRAFVGGGRRVPFLMKAEQRPFIRLHVSYFFSSLPKISLCSASLTIGLAPKNCFA